MKRTILFIFIVLLITSCATQAKGKKGKTRKPVWLENPKAVYHEQRYLTAIGEGDSRMEAENYAAASLSKIFESKVKADETYTQMYKEIIKNDESSYEELTDVTKTVNIQSDQTLYNVQFADSYTDELGRVHVLAYLNRFKTGEIYEEKINKNSSQIEYFIKQSNSTKDILDKYATMSAASAFCMNNEILLDQLGIISPDTKEFLEINYNHNEIVKSTVEIAKGIKFRIKIENDTENKISILLEEMLTDLGFVMSEDAVLNVVGSISFEETNLDRDDDFVFVRYDLKLKIKDNDEAVLAALTEKGKEGHTIYLEAKERAIRKIGQKIQKSLKKKLISYFNSLVAQNK